jgi:hypothetical protein
MPPAQQTRLPRRSTDWFEDAVAWLLSVVAVLGLGVALAVGLSEFAAGTERARVESATRVPADATLVADAPRATESFTGVPLVQVPATVTVTAPDGEQKVGTAAVGVGTRAGATVPVWLTSDGEMTSAPGTPSGALAAGVGAGLAVLVADACVILAAWLTARRLALALNVRSWEREWERVEPMWSRWKEPS